MNDNPSTTEVEPRDAAPPSTQPHAAQGATNQPLPAPSGSEQPETSPSNQGLRYLIVEDNAVTMKILTKLLGRLGLDGQFHMTTDGQEGVDAYKKDPQQCRFIFMDILMPVKSGTAASQEIREYERENDLAPAVILGMTTGVIRTDGVDEEVERLKNEFGMDGVIEKPFRPQVLESFIKKWPV